MKLTKMPSEFQKALPVLEKIKEAGFEAYFVGGSVRDAFLTVLSMTWISRLHLILKRPSRFFHAQLISVLSMGTVLVLDGDEEYEVTTFRTEDVYVDYRRPSSVSFVRSLEEDLKTPRFHSQCLCLG